jgi:adenine phosphoribosyltransferase
MATLDSLKRKLRRAAAEIEPSQPAQMSPLSDAQYSAGFDSFKTQTAYRDFITPQLSSLLESLLETRPSVSILEVGPGPKSVLGRLPVHLQRRISRYAAFEPNRLFASKLEESLRDGDEVGGALPCLATSPDIQTIPFPPEEKLGDGSQDKFDLVLFCHSMCGMKNKHQIIEHALGLLREESGDEMVVVFHRDGSLKLDGLACRQMAVFPMGVVHVRDSDEALVCFADFVAGSAAAGDTVAAKSVHEAYRETCRALGGNGKTGYLLFRSPEIMVTFEKQATNVSVLTAQVPLVSGESRIENREARIRHPAAVVRPESIQQVQECVSWALENRAGLSIVGGSHSGNCSWSHVVAVDMSAFSGIRVFSSGSGDGSASTPAPLVVVGAGCTSGSIISTPLKAGLTVPLGSRPSVGAGLWLQGGIGHLSRLHGLSSDAIVGAVIVSVADGRIMHIGSVPVQHRPTGSVRPDNEGEMLWMLKGAGTNLGVVISVTFQACKAPMYAYRNWVFAFDNTVSAVLALQQFDESIACKLPKHCSADAYLFCEGGELQLGITIFEASPTGMANEEPAMSAEELAGIMGPGEASKVVNSVGLFQAEMYMSGMHGGHAGGKTSSFKRCLFLKHIGTANISRALLAAIESRPSPLCYLHLLHGGGAIGEVAAEDTAFGCRDWDFACVVTGVWPRDQDGTANADEATQWVYDVVKDLLPISSGVYGADLGPDPRDAELAMKAFGPNQPRLARLKSICDPKDVLAYACPLPSPPHHPHVIFLVTDESCAGKDYCADVWASTLSACNSNIRRVRVASISEAIKLEYAKATGADVERLLCDRGYKEQHRQALTAYFLERAGDYPNYPPESFLKLVHNNAGVDVLFVTGMRESGPVAAVAHLVPGTRVIEICIQTSEDTRRARGATTEGTPYPRRGLIFDNHVMGEEAVKAFAERRLLPFFDVDLHRLAKMVPAVVDFPRPGVTFQDVLKIAQQQGGLKLCASLMQRLSTIDWTGVDAIIGCEAGGFIFASALAIEVDVPLVLIRKAGKVPPPTISASKSASHVSRAATGGLKGERIEVDRALISKARSVVVVDDVLATGSTLRAVLSLLTQAGIQDSHITVMVVAEFPAHRGRDMLSRSGFGRTQIQSLLVFEGT